MKGIATSKFGGAPLASVWSKWITEHHHDGWPSRQLPHTLVTRSLLGEMESSGYMIPPRRQMDDILARGMEPLEVIPSGHRGYSGNHHTKFVSFAHAVNLVVAPLCDYIHGLANSEEPQWAKSLDTNFLAVMDLVGREVPHAHSAMDIDTWISFLQKDIRSIVHVDVSKEHITEVLAMVVPLNMDLTLGTQRLLLLTSAVMSKLIGPSLAVHVKRVILAQLSNVPVSTYSDLQMGLMVREDLVEALGKLHTAAPQEETHVLPLKRRRTTDEGTRRDRMKAITQQVLTVVQCRMTWSRFEETLVGGASLLKALKGEEDSQDQRQGARDLLVSRQNLSKHLVILDSALDAYHKDFLFKQREQGNLAGVAIATDESPPKQPRFGGLRFQITLMYAGTYRSLADWETLDDPPITRTSVLGDIMHCPGKKGKDVWNILEKQLHRLGLSTHDVVAGVGDGGGENEGETGVHHSFEEESGGYVRKRCLPHIAWRVADQAIVQALSLSELNYRGIIAYLREGITWARLRDIAIKPQGDGGLALMRDGSPECKRVFGTGPGPTLEGRPETDLNALRALFGREHALHLCARRDLTQRTTLETSKVDAVNALGHIERRLFRAILMEILERCMFLARWNSKHTHVAEELPWDALVKKAVDAILDRSVAPLTLERLGFGGARTPVPLPATWIHLLTEEIAGGDLVPEYIEKALRFHREVSGKAAAHLALVGDNTFRTPWLAAQLLSKTPMSAQDAARALLKHLNKTRPSARTLFEQYLCNTKYLHDNLVEFTREEPPLLLWRGHGKFEALFKFLAPRFLLCPDHVLDCERVHARWQWCCDQKRAIKLYTLNALLRTSHLAERTRMPTDAELFQYLEAERALVTSDVAHARCDDIAMGWRSSELSWASKAGAPLFYLS